MTIYVVMGTCGEYSDRTEWPVKAWRTKEAAEAHVVRAGRVAKDAYAELMKEGKYYFDDEVPDTVKTEDPNVKFYDGGSEYFIYEVELAA